MDKALGETLRAMREQHGLTQTDVAEQLAANRVTVARWENGTRSLSHNALAAYSAVVGVSPSVVYATVETVHPEAVQAAVPDTLAGKAQQLARDIDARRFGGQKGA